MELWKPVPPSVQTTSSVAGTSNLPPETELTLTAQAAETTSALVYQWHRNNVPIPGATNAALLLSGNVEGQYHVKVTDTAGQSAESTQQLVLIAIPLVIEMRSIPVDTSNLPFNATVELSIEASGREPFSYRWYRNGVNAKGKPLAKVTSKAFAVKVVVPPALTLAAPKPVIEGKTMKVSAKVKGTARFAYEWRGPNGGVGNGASLSLKKVSLAQAGSLHTPCCERDG